MADIKYYDVILKPVITEKSMNAMAEKKYTFLVHPEATKSQIKEAVEKMFEDQAVPLRYQGSPDFYDHMYKYRNHQDSQ